MKKLLIVTVALLFVLPFAASAQDEYDTTWNTWVGFDDPLDVPITPGAPCVAPWVECDNDSSYVYDIDLSGKANLYIGIYNRWRWVFEKEIDIVIRGNGFNNITIEWIRGWLDGGQTVGRRYEAIIVTPTEIRIKAWIFPQSHWEVINLNTGVGVINRIVVTTTCRFVPTMTHYGLGILALLLIGSTVWILRRRRVGSVA